MKKIIIIILLFLIIVFIFLFKNETFNKKMYLNKVVIPKYSYLIKKSKILHENGNKYWSNSIELLSLKNQKDLETFRNNFIENLKSCYDESYFYDAKNDITYSMYDITDNTIVNNIKINFIYGNICENEYVLNEDWLEVLKISTIMHYNFNYDLLITKLENSTRIETKEILPFDDTYQITCLNKKYGYTIYVTEFSENVIGIILSDANDMKKYALYDIKENANKFLKNL